MAKKPVEDNSGTKNKKTTVTTNTNTSNLAGVDYQKQAVGTPKVSTSSSGSTGLNTNASNLANTNNIQNAGGTVRNTTKSSDVYVSNYSKPTVTNSYVAKANLNKAENKNALSSMADSSTKKANQVVNAIDSFVSNVKNTIYNANQDYRNDIQSQRQARYDQSREKVYAEQDAKRNETLKTLTKEDLDKFYNQDGTPIDYDSQIQNLNSKKTTLEAMIKNAENDGQAMSAQAELDTVLKQMESLDILKNKRDALEEDYNLRAYRESGDEQAYRSYREALAHKDDSMLERFGSAGSHLLAQTINEIPTALDQGIYRADVGNAMSGMEALKAAYESGEIDTDSYVTALGEIDQKIKEAQNRYNDSTSQEIRRVVDQYGANTFYGANDIEKFILQAGESTAQFMLHYAIGTAVASAAMGATALELGGDIATTTMSLTSATEKTNQLLDEGYDIQTAYRNGLFTGLVSYATEKVGMDRFVDMLKTPVSANLMGQIILRNAKSGLSEGLEEVVEGLVDPLVDAATLGTDYEVNGNELYMSFLLGGTSGLIMSNAATIGSAVQTNYKLGQLIVANRQQREALINEINTLKASLPSMDELHKEIAAQEIKKGEDAVYTYDSMSATLGITFSTDFVEEPSPAEAEYAVVETLVPNFNQEVQTTAELDNLQSQVDSNIDGIIDVENSILAQTQEMLNSNGYNIDAGVFNSLDSKRQNDALVALDFAKMMGINANVVDDAGIYNAIAQYGFNGSQEELQRIVDGTSGLVTPDGQIFINGSKRPILFTLTHELTHGTESSKYYPILRDLVRAEYGDNWQNALNEKAEQYKGIEDFDAEKEVVARYVEEFLGDEKFIDDLIKYNYSLASKIFQDLNAFGNNDETVKIRNAFEKAFADNYQQNESQFSIDQQTHKNAAKEEFGTTDDYNKAGYILDDGELLDLSEGQDRRTQDHRSVGYLFDDLDYARDGMSAGMIKFMNEGNIRILPENGGVDISNVVEPTAKQYDAIYDYLRNYNDEWTKLDVSDEKGYNVFSVEYPPNTSPGVAIADIKTYFEDGTIPEAYNPDNIFQFSFDPDYEKVNFDSRGLRVNKNLANFMKGTKLTDPRGRLLRLHHTSPVTFTEFDPRGSNRYRFGNSVVNYYSTSSAVSGSYTGGEFVEFVNDYSYKNFEDANKRFKELTRELEVLRNQFSDYKLAKYREIFDIINGREFQKELKNTISKIEKLDIPKDDYSNMTAYIAKEGLIDYLQTIKDQTDNSLIVGDRLEALDSTLVDLIGKDDLFGNKVPHILAEAVHNLYDSSSYKKMTEIASEVNKEYSKSWEEQQKLREKRSYYEKYGEATGRQYIGYGKALNPYIVEGRVETDNYSKTVNWNDINNSANTFKEDEYDLDDLSNLYNVFKEVYDSRENNLPKQKQFELVLENVNEKNREFFLKNPIALANMFNYVDRRAIRYYENLETSTPQDAMYTNINRNIVIPEYLESEFSKHYDEIMNLASEIALTNGRESISNSDFDDAMSQLGYVETQHFTGNNDLETNDVVKAILAINEYAKKNGGETYDGVIFRNITDSGSFTGRDIASDIIALFSSNQFKLVGNENPTESGDIRYSFDKTQESVPTENESVSSPYFGYGRNPARNVDILKETKAGPTSRFWNNLANSEYVSDEEAVRIQKMVEDGLGAYEATTNKKQQQEARKMIRQMGLEDSFKYAMNADKMATADVDTVFCKELLNEMNQKGLSGTENYKQLEARLAWRSTMSGRAEQAFNTFRTQTPEGQVITIRSEVQRIQEGLNERYGDGAYDIKINEELIEQYLRARSQEERDNLRLQIATDIAKQIPPTILEQLNSYRHLSMLFNPRTWIKNRLANELFGYVNEVTRTVRVLGEAMYEKAGGKIDRQAGIYNPFSGKDREAYKKAIEDYGKHYSDVDMKYSTVDAGNVLLGSEFGQQVAMNRDQFTWNWLNKIAELNAKMLSDRPGMSKAYAKSLTGYLKTKGLTFETATEEQMEKAREFAYKEARYATFNSDNKLANYIVEGNRKLLERKDALGYAGHAIIESFIPFKRTPLNLLATGVRYSPAGLVITMTDDLVKLKKGKITATQFIDNMAQGLTGSGIMALGALLYSLGVFRTKDDDKDRKKYFDQENGEQDYSIYWDGGSYTIDWADPMIIPLSMGAEVAKLMEDGTLTADDAYSLMTAMAQPLFETSMMSGITNNLKSFANDNTGYATDIFKNAGTNFALQFIPSVLGAVARTVDDTRRSTYTDKGNLDKVKKQAMNKIPGLSQKNEPYINRSGEEEKTEDLGMGVAGRAILNFLSPGYYSSKDIDKYDEEMYRLLSETGEADALPSSTSKSVTFNKENFKFTDKEYTEWNRTRWSTEAEYVNQFMDSNAYKGLTDQERVATIEDIRSYAQKVAKRQFLESKGYEYTDDKELAESNPEKYVYDKELTNAGGAIDHDIKLYAYYDYLNNAGSKQAEKIAYLEESDLTQAQKEYLYDLSGYKTSYEDAYKKTFGKSNKKTTGKSSSSKKSSGASKKASGSAPKTKVSTSSGSKAKFNKISAAPQTTSSGTKNVAKSYLKAYAKSMKKQNVSGGSQTQVCPNCGSRVPANASRCPNCGAAL